MSRPPLVKVDVAVIGSGLQALCTLKELVTRNYTAVLLSKGGLGGGQTAHSHAFLHEGHMFRWADNIKHTQASQRDWEEYLTQPEAKAWEGDFYFGDVDETSFDSFYTNWEAHIPNLGSPSSTPPSGFASGLKYWKGRGVCLNTSWVVKHVSSVYENYISLTNNIELTRSTPEGVVIQAENSNHEMIQIEARRIVAAAGVGNHALIGLPIPIQARQQTVQAHMLLVRPSEKLQGGLAPIAGFFRPVFGKPEALFIAPRILDGKTIWLISDGTRKMAKDDDLCKVKWDEAETCEWVNKLMNPLSALSSHFFGSDKREQLEWAVHCAAKAEKEQTGGKMPRGPEHCCIDERSICVVWPTLLTHIPRMSRLIAENNEWFGGFLCKLTTEMLDIWSKWRRPPTVAVEDWRSVEFQTWNDFKARYSLH